MASESQRPAFIEPSDKETDNEQDIDISRRDVDYNIVLEVKDEIAEDGKRDMIHLIQNLSKYLCSLEENGEELAAGFQRIPNRRVLPDYFETISTPIAFSTIRGKIQRKQYVSFSEFVKDVAQICHNAQVYNRPSAPIFGAAVRLRELFRDKLQKLAAAGDISSDDADLPDLGELPPAEDSAISSLDEEEDNVDHEEDEDGEDEDKDHGKGSCGEDVTRLQEQQRRLRHNRHLRASSHENDLDEDNDDSSQKNMRPFIVLTPTEARITSILKGLRKLKDGRGGLFIRHFEKLPDKSHAADYYKTVSRPIAMDSIRKKAKQKTYQNVDQVLSDLELMFENAKLSPEKDSEVAKAAVDLQRHARSLAAQEISRPDEDFRGEDGSLSLEAIENHGQTWRAGDWVHIRNPNDPDKPIVAQIFRTWQDRNRQNWVNTCWYYRPEQTVHRHDKYFFEREVVKTSQYRNHHVDEILDRCFVMFVTHFIKGRPRGLPPNKEVYVCESLYNEEKFRFHKIKTWVSCLPDEASNNDYEMDLFDVPYRMKKVPSPIKHLLRDDVVKAADELARPTWGSQNAPPIVGAVHRLPPEPNVSYFISSPVLAIYPVASSFPCHVSRNIVITIGWKGEQDTSFFFLPRRSLGNAELQSLAAAYSTYIPEHAISESPSQEINSLPITIASDMDGGSKLSLTREGPPETSARASLLSLSHHSNAHMISHTRPATPASSVPSAIHQTSASLPLVSHQASILPQVPVRSVHYQYQQQYQMHASYSQNYPSAGTQIQQPGNNHFVSQQWTNQAHFPPVTRASLTPQAAHSIYNQPRHSEVFILPESVNNAVPIHLRQRFQGEHGRDILFFAGPPLGQSHKGFAPGCAGLGHSVRYLAGRRRWLSERAKKRKDRDDAIVDNKITKRVALTGHESMQPTEPRSPHAADALEVWFLRLNQETRQWRKDVGLEEWDKLGS
ncbi:hypothetical protein CP533_4660 [Ophiocordyceps camponoti-saundersi (nom. inval.)]|nr:hypothetical protein CP533_4660 [Ophiocordyceps camponoti-saundersi (nom. inval.)]